MQIRDMFAQDINRLINGVIKVDQDADSIIAQEVREYVVTFCQLFQCLSPCL